MFFTFSQNNSGGYFVEDEERGVNECVIVEADTAEAAIERLHEIGADVDGFWSFCSCCGERWNEWLDDDDGTESPELYNTPIEKQTAQMFRKAAFVHYADGNFKKFEFPESA